MESKTYLEVEPRRRLPPRDQEERHRPGEKIESRTGSARDFSRVQSEDLVCGHLILIERDQKSIHVTNLLSKILPWCREDTKSATL